MIRHIATIGLLLVTGSVAEAGWEIAFLGGWTAPTFEETFTYQLDLGLPSFPGVAIRQEGEFSLKARGSFAFGGSVTYYFTDFFGIEGRVDTVDFRIDTIAPSFIAEAELHVPLPRTSVTVDLGQGEVNVERLRPFSANLKLRTPGAARFVVSGGLSYLPSFRLEASQELRLGVTALGFPLLDVATAGLRAVAASDAADESPWGINGGAGLELDVSEKVAIIIEGRVYSFKQRTFAWEGVQAPSSLFDELLLEQLVNELDPIEIEPLYFQVTGGIVIRF